jgi:membrane protein YdbS with pleckstrin-like domain
MYLPLPDELIERYLGQGEQKIHSDHPSFRAFVITNGLLVLALLVATGMFLGFVFGGSVLGGLLIGLVVVGVGTALFVRRLSEAYTSYVITNVRVIRLSGVISRKMHSIPWVRVTDLSMEQNLVGRLLGYATVHIESANEDSGLRDLRGVSDPVRFHSYLVDMVVAKQGPIDVVIAERPHSGGLRQRVRSARARARDRSRVDALGSAVTGAPDDEPTQVVESGVRAPSSSSDPYYADRRQIIVRPSPELSERSERVEGPEPLEPSAPDPDELGPPPEAVDRFVEGFRGAGGGVPPDDARDDLGDLSDVGPSEREGRDSRDLRWYDDH